ncbi:aquaporin-8a.1 [Aplochiton taeniatus]
MTVESKSEMVTMPGVDTGSGPGTKKKASSFERYIQPCLAEMLGTALFVFVGCESVIGSTGLPGLIQAALAHGLALGAVIMMFGEISGGHFNPAVSLAVYLCGGTEILLTGVYVLAQMFGAMTGAGLAKAVSSFEMYHNATGGAVNAIKSSDGVGGAMVAETVMTSFLTLVVCMGAVNGKTRTQLAPLYIGLIVTANILAGGSVSGGCMNPARAFGPAVAAGHWEYHWVYWVGPTAGALVTVSLVRLLFGDQKLRVWCN